MERLMQLDKQKYLAEMRAEMERVLGKVVDAVNAAPEGQVIDASEWEVHDLMEGLRRVAYQTAVRMLVDSTEESFPPSQGRNGPAQAEQGA